MKSRVRFAEQVVGAFILLAILSVGTALVLLGLNQRWVARNSSFWSRFSSTEGLSAGMALKLKGFEIGKVDRIRLGSDNLVDMEFHVFDTYYQKVLPGSVLELYHRSFQVYRSLSLKGEAARLLPLLLALAERTGRKAEAENYCRLQADLEGK